MILDLMFDGYLTGYAAIFWRENMNFLKMAAYPATWLSDIKFDMSNGLSDPDNLISDIYLDCSKLAKCKIIVFHISRQKLQHIQSHGHRTSNLISPIDSPT